MVRFTFKRRSFVALTVGSTIAGIGIGQSTGSAVARDSFVLMEGTDHETTVYETTADADGPTVLVAGGMHGNEVAGYVAAGEIANWEIDAGTLVTIPEANAVAVDSGRRTGTDGVDLNRQFPVGSEPRTDLARAIWDAVLEYEPDVVIDLHESIGVYAGDPVDGVGQAIFHSPIGDAAVAAHDAVTHVNERYVDEPRLRFQTGTFSGPENEPNGLLVHKADRETAANAYLVETLSTDVDLETRVLWQTAIVRQLADGLFADETGTIPEETEDAPDEPSDEEPAGDDGDDDPDDADGESDSEEGTDDAEDGTGDGDDGVDGEDGSGDEDEDAEEGDEEGPTPTARIEVADDVDVSALEYGQTVTLDATASSAPTCGLADYRWDIGSDGTFDKSGASIEVTLTACGEFPVVLMVTDDEGRTDTAEIALATD